MLITPKPGRHDPTHVAAFRRFLDAFPARDGGHDEEAAHEAFIIALRRASAETILAGAAAYARATEGRERRYVMSARRWLAESRWRDAAPVSGSARPAQVWVGYGSREWEAWRRHWIETRNKSPPLDRRGGWRFPTRWPPEQPQPL